MSLLFIAGICSDVHKRDIDPSVQCSVSVLHIYATHKLRGMNVKVCSVFLKQVFMPYGFSLYWCKQVFFTRTVDPMSCLNHTGEALIIALMLNLTGIIPLFSLHKWRQCLAVVLHGCTEGWRQFITQLGHDRFTVGGPQYILA